MSNLKLDVRQLGRTVTMKVLEQHVSLVGTGLIDKYEDLELKSTNRPALNKNEVYIGGRWGIYSKDTVETTLPSEYEAFDYIRKLKTLESRVNNIHIDEGVKTLINIKDKLIGARIDAIREIGSIHSSKIEITLELNNKEKANLVLQKNA